MTADRAISPVLGEALLIAIVVVLAGVVAFMALNVDIGSVNQPTAAIEFSETSTPDGITVRATHLGGPPLFANETAVTVHGGGDGNLTTTVSAGDTAVVATACDPGDEVVIVWNDPDSTRSAIVARHSVDG